MVEPESRVAAVAEDTMVLVSCFVGAQDLVSYSVTQSLLLRSIVKIRWLTLGYETTEMYAHGPYTAVDLKAPLM